MNHHHPNEPEDLIAAAINAAEDIRGPLDGRVEQTATDPGALFALDVLADGRGNPSPNPLTPLLARMLRDARLWRELLGIALTQARERDQDYQKLHLRYIVLLEQYRAVRRANADRSSIRAGSSREAA